MHMILDIQSNHPEPVEGWVSDEGGIAKQLATLMRCLSFDRLRMIVIESWYLKIEMVPK